MTADGMPWPRVPFAPAGQTPAEISRDVDMERRAGVQEALGLCIDRRPGYAFFKLSRSVERQLRIAGHGTVSIPACACGGRGCDMEGRR